METRRERRKVKRRQQSNAEDRKADKENKNPDPLRGTGILRSDTVGVLSIGKQDPLKSVRFQQGPPVTVDVFNKPLKRVQVSKEDPLSSKTKDPLTNKYDDEKFYHHRLEQPPRKEEPIFPPGKTVGTIRRTLKLMFSLGVYSPEVRRSLSQVSIVNDH